MGTAEVESALVAHEAVADVDDAEWEDYEEGFAEDCGWGLWGWGIFLPWRIRRLLRG